MKKKVKHSIIFYIFIVLISICFFLLIVFNFYGFITGKGFFPFINLEEAFLDIISRAFIGAEMSYIAISSPQSTTYYFGIGDSYLIDLNVSAFNFIVDKWWYNLYDSRHNVLVINRTIFVPNITLTAVRWNNTLQVYANDSSGNIFNVNVSFFISVPNSAPIIQNLETDYFVCEDTVFSTIFNASDDDENSLTASISPTSTFFLSYLMSNVNLTWRNSEIFSGVLGKSKVGLHKKTISVSDGYLSDSKNINITVIGVNHAPLISNIGAQTVYTLGDNSTFYYEVQVNDLEDGNNERSGNFTFNLTFLTGDRFFNISSYGIINVSANSTFLGVYNLSLCVDDHGLIAPHENITDICGTNGSSLKSCINFSLTITEENRRPEITSYNPSDLDFDVNGTDTIRFNITKHDPDGTVPDAYWYVDNTLKEFDSGSPFDEFSYSFGCDVSGAHRIKVIVSDGLLNNSLQWNITVNPVSCAVISPGGGGGGGGILPPLICKPKWGCFAWGICERVTTALEKGILSGADYTSIKEICTRINLTDEYCGYQKRVCEDVNYCNSSIEEPEKIQFCNYSFMPSCSDGIKNCHDDDCEVLVDCGGPCSQCPTCSDGIQNQGEEGVDCGQPCPKRCPQAGPVYTHYYTAFLIFLFILLGIIALAIAIKVYKGMRKLKKAELSYKK